KPVRFGLLNGEHLSFAVQEHFVTDLCFPENPKRAVSCCPTVQHPLVYYFRNPIVIQVKQSDPYIQHSPMQLRLGCNFTDAACRYSDARLFRAKAHRTQVITNSLGNCLPLCIWNLGLPEGLFCRQFLRVPPIPLEMRTDGLLVRL